MSDLIIGVQSYTYREFSAVEAVREAASVGLKAIEMWPKHVNYQSGAEEIGAFRKALEDRGIWMCGYGVCGLEQLGDEMEPTFAFAKEMGAYYVSINCGRDNHEIAEQAIAIAKQYGLKLGIHNHGPGASFETAEQVLAFCEGKDALLGACVDTGHFMRSDQMPDHVIKVLGRRINSMHLKDFVSAEEEVIPGTGRLDFAQALALLKSEAGYEGAYVIEYEADPKDPSPAIKQTLDVLMKAAEG